MKLVTVENMYGVVTQTHGSAPLGNIKKLQFGVLSPEELVSVTKIHYRLL